MMHLFNLTFRMSGDSSPQASATSQPAPTFGFVFDGIFIYKAKAIIHGVFSVFSNLKQVKTPEVNRRILVPHGFAAVQCANKFRTIYKHGRQLIR